MGEKVHNRVGSAVHSAQRVKIGRSESAKRELPTIYY